MADTPRAVPLTEQREPDFIIIGAQKCGTTSLYAYLCQHPQVKPAAKKEVRYFDRKFEHGPEWYRGHFPPVKPFPGILTGEASPSYIFHPLAASRMKAECPKVKLIVLLRNPVDRAYSHYHHSVRLGRTTLSFEDSIDREAALLHGERERFTRDETYKSDKYWFFSYLSRGRYLEQLRIWMDVFPRESFLILRSEDFFADPAHLMQDVFQWLGLPAHQLQEYRKVNIRGYRPYNPMAPAMRERLVEYFRTWNLELYDFLNLDMAWDS